MLNKLSPMWNKPEGWAEAGPNLNAWVEGLPTHFLKKLWDLAIADDDADPGCFLAEAIQLEMQYRGQGSYVAL
jgi:hypothetical protein